MVRTEDYQREFLLIFFIQRRIILLTTLLVLGLSVAIVKYWPPTYAASGTVLVKAKQLTRSPESLENVQLRTVLVDKEDLNSEAEILTSMEVVQTAVNNLYEQELAFTGKVLSEEDLKGMADDIRYSLKTIIHPNSNVVRVKMHWKNKEDTHVILNEIMENYVKRRRDIFNPKGMEDFFTSQVEQYSSALEQQEGLLVELAKKSGSANAIQEITNNLTLKMELKRQLYAARTKWFEKSEFLTQIRTVLTLDGIHFFSFIDNISISHLGDQLQMLVVERGKQLRLYHPESKQIKRIDEQVSSLSTILKQEVGNYADAIASELLSLERQTEKLRQEIATIEQRNITLYQGHLEWERMQRELDLRAQSFKTFSKRLEEARIGSGTNAANLFSISILSYPQPSAGPTFPEQDKVIPLGLLSGFILGCCIGFIAEFFDHTFKRPEDAERYAGVPTLFSIPKHGKF